MKILIMFVVLSASLLVKAETIQMTCQKGALPEVVISMSDSNAVTVTGFQYLSSVPSGESLELHLARFSKTNNSGQENYLYFKSEYQAPPDDSFIHLEVKIDPSNKNQAPSVTLTDENYNGGDQITAFSPDQCKDPKGQVMARMVGLAQGKLKASSVIASTGLFADGIYRAGVKVAHFHDMGTLACEVDQVFLSEYGRPSATVKNCGVQNYERTAVIHGGDLIDSAAISIPAPAWNWK